MSKEFEEFVKSLPATHWAKYDLAAVQFGWEGNSKRRLNVEDSKEGLEPIYLECTRLREEIDFLNDVIDELEAPIKEMT